MKANLSNMNNAYRVNQQQMALNILLNQKKSVTNGSVDTFIRSDNTLTDAGLYSAFGVKKNGYISDALLTLINNDVSNVVKHGEVYECAGVRFTADQIPEVDMDLLSEIKGKNNVLDFGKNNYFKYVSSDGVEHAVYTSDKGIGDVNSEDMRGAAYDETLQKYVDFWLYMTADDPVYIGLSYSDEEIRQFLNEAGMENGFFTVKMGNKEATQFYSGGKNEGAIHSKEKYDIQYKHITSTGLRFTDYEPGCIFKIGDKEYVLSENRTLDIPYGADIYNIKYPENYRFGKKIE